MKQTKKSGNPKEGSKLSRKQIETLYGRFDARAPVPKTELNYHNSYTLLVAVTLSAQATDKGVNKATEKLFKIVKTPQDMLALGEEKLKSYIATLNFYPTKARNLIAMAERLMAVFDGEVPANRKDLESLAGVGRKTANVVLSVAFDQPTVAVDTHIFRVANRTGLAPGKTPLDVELLLEKVTPSHYLSNAHHWLVLHGRYICKARKPDCAGCFISDLCQFENKVGL